MGTRALLALRSSQRCGSNWVVTTSGSGVTTYLLFQVSLWLQARPNVFVREDGRRIWVQKAC